MKPSPPLISIILATHNRRAVVIRTLEQLRLLELTRRDFEVIVVDNASTDGTFDAIQPMADVVIPLRRNEGSCAKSHGVDRARGRFIVFLDDDSYPHQGSLERMIEHFEAEPRLGAAGFTIHLPSGQQECAALPDVFVGCGVGFRADALRAVGGLDRTFFMQAEEYDLSFRLAAAGCHVRVFDDLHVDHLKTEQARRSARTTFFDIRNNLRVLARYLPPPQYSLYRADTIQRYSWLAERDGHVSSFRRGLLAGLIRGGVERLTHRAQRLAPEVFESFYRWSMLRGHMTELARTGIGRIVFADLGKNIVAFFQAARHADMNILAIGDDRFAAPIRAATVRERNSQPGGQRTRAPRGQPDGHHRTYRGIPVLPLDDALGINADAIAVSNMASVFAKQTADRVRARTHVPVYDWFGEPANPAFLGRNGARFHSTHAL